MVRKTSCSFYILIVGNFNKTTISITSITDQFNGKTFHKLRHPIIPKYLYTCILWPLLHIKKCIGKNTHRGRRKYGIILSYRHVSMLQSQFVHIASFKLATFSRFYEEYHVQYRTITSIPSGRWWFLNSTLLNPL